MVSQLPARNLGLDIMRSLAIGLVLIAHSLTFFFRWSHIDLNAAYYVLGFLGVELFFALSGFLIGRILLEEVLRDRSWQSLGRFYVRRWLRTLPPYYLVLALLPLTGRHFNWNSLVFLQNFSRKDLEFFPVSWSLSIEEWFYLLVPLALLLAARLTRTRPATAFFTACLGIIVLSLLLRATYVLGYDPTWDFGIRKKPPLRMDSLMVGVALAGVSIHLPRAWALLASWRRVLFPVAVVGIAYTGGYQLWKLYQEHTVDSSVYARTTLFFLVSAFMGALLVCLETSHGINVAGSRRRWTRVFHFLSVTSYAAYLLHLEIFDFFAPLEAKSLSAWTALLLVAASLTLTLLFSAVMHRWYEKPILRFRDRVTRHRPSASAV
jgi:peptidoglycan/LPS O-acetylase OafA/YrhL